MKIRSRMSIPITLNFNAIILPIGSLVPLVIALSRYTDNRHHPTDIIGGVLLGGFIAICIHKSDVLAARKISRSCSRDTGDSEITPLDVSVEYDRTFESEDDS